MKLHKIDKQELQTSLISGGNFVLFTEDFSGHRLDWLKKLYELSLLKDIKIFIVCVDISRLQENDIENNFEFSEVGICQIKWDEYRSLRHFYKGLNLNSNVVAIWDGDKKLFALFFTRLKFNVLFMRPYRTTKTFSGLLRNYTKIIAICALKLISNHSIGLLSIPQDSHRILQSNWIDDEVLLSLKNEDLGVRNEQGDIRILVPGYISSRKNPKLIVTACEKLRDEGVHNFILEFNGSIAEDQLDYLRSKECEWIIINDGYKSEGEFTQVLSSSNLVLLPYENRGSSGLVIHSLIMGNYVAISKFRGWRNLEYMSKGKLKLMDNTLKGIYTTIRNFIELPNKEYDSFHPLIEGRESAVSFLMKKS